MGVPSGRLASMTYKLVLLRHGQSAWNKTNQFTGWVDVPLTEQGVEEAKNGGRLLKEKNVLPDIVFTSLLRRAINTANIALDAADRLWIPVQRDWRLNERHYGALQGKNKTEIREEYGDEKFMLWRRSYATPPPEIDPNDEYAQNNDPRYTGDPVPEAECLADVVKRVEPYFKSDIEPELKAGKTVLIAAHGNSLRAIVKMAHEAGMLCLADEAHGTHFYFGNGLPVSAMAAGADMASVSMHKSGGSLTQSSLLLIGPNVHQGYVRQIINLTQTTSGSYLLMSSLDISRRNLAQRGRQVFHQVADMAEYAREEINAVGGYYAFGKELCNGDSVFDFDTTKLSVHTLDIGLAGIEVYDILRDEYDIQIEFGDIGNILAYLSIGDRPQEVERLVSALAEIKRRYQTDGSGLLSQEYIDPVVAASPQEAFYAPKKSLPLRETEGMVCSEFVMCYPPGIPILAPGERITKEILNYIEYAKAKGCSMTGPEDPDIERLNVLA